MFQNRGAFQGGNSGRTTPGFPGPGQNNQQHGASMNIMQMPTGGPPQGYHHSSPAVNSAGYTNPPGPMYSNDVFGQNHYPGHPNQPQGAMHNGSQQPYFNSPPGPTGPPTYNPGPSPQIPHATLPFNPHMSQDVQGTNEELRSRIESLESQVAAMKVSVTALEAMEGVVKSLQEKMHDADGLGDKRGRIAMKGLSNQHPDLKILIHSMFWGMLDIDINDDDRQLKMSEGFDAPEAFVKVGDKEIWKPDWSKAVNTGKNKKFISEVVLRVYNNETTKRTANAGELNDMSYDQVVMRALAQTYFATLSSAWKKNRTPEGAAKLAAENEKKKNRARREGVTNARRKSAITFQEKNGISGVVGLLDTDFASSLCSVDEGTISEDTKARRRDQQCRVGEWEIRGKKWRTKNYVRLLRELDQLTTLRESLLSNLDTDGVPVKKKPKKNTKKPTRRFHGNISKASERAPASLKSPPTIPAVGMVKKSWLSRQPADQKVDLVKNPEWWAAWKASAPAFPVEVQKYWDELPNDTASETEESVEMGEAASTGEASDSVPVDAGSIPTL